MIEVTFNKPTGKAYTGDEVSQMCADVRKATGSSNSVIILRQGDCVVAYGYTTVEGAKPVYVALNNLHPDLLAFGPIRACSDYELTDAEINRLAEVGITERSFIPKERGEQGTHDQVEPKPKGKPVKPGMPDFNEPVNDKPTNLSEFERKKAIPGGKGKFEPASFDEVVAFCIDVASRSECTKRKVGCVIMHDGEYVAHSCNLTGPGGSEAKEDVVHAEVNAINMMEEGIANGVKPRGMANQFLRERYTLYCTHEPCAGCRAAIKAAGITQVIVVEQFMKFDAGKLRHDLIPAIVYTALAAIFTYGAKKYSPNNWQQCKDLGQYKAAVMRHWVAYINGERLDADSGKPHLWHVLTNVAFLIWFDDQESKQNEK
ncbi:MAG: DUF5664 domain-containing protein [Gammaproteobacteria bacterium]|nr:DUF5664 domain-containing protein [Gammaproteobacteria bacterium]